MHRLALAYFVITLVSQVPASAQTLYTCGEGTVRRIESIAEISASLPSGEATDGRLQYSVTVELHDVLYTARSSSDSPWNFDPTELMVNQAINACASASQIVLDRNDGTDYRGAVYSVSRQPAPPAASTQPRELSPRLEQRLKTRIRLAPDLE